MPTDICPYCNRKATSSAGQVAVSRDCHECRSTGQIVCTRCGGEGATLNRDHTKLEDCTRCQYQGWVRHDICNGTGQVWVYVACTAETHRRRRN
jgi:RecJ-like exonuclease